MTQRNEVYPSTEATKMSYIRFDEVDNPGKKTRRWHVHVKDGGNLLGWIGWYSAWRKHCFYPCMGTVFEQDCLREIADFCEARTKEHKAKKPVQKPLNQEKISRILGSTMRPCGRSAFGPMGAQALVTEYIAGKGGAQ